MSLAFADLLVSVLVMPFGAIELVQDIWIYGEMFCLVRTSLDVLLTTGVYYKAALTVEAVLCNLLQAASLCANTWYKQEAVWYNLTYVSKHFSLGGAHYIHHVVFISPFKRRFKNLFKQALAALLILCELEIVGSLV